MRILLTTAPPDKAEQIVEKMVADRWVACGNILPGVQSIYRWKGEICREPESMVIMETKAEKSTQAMKSLESMRHPLCKKLTSWLGRDGNHRIPLRACSP